MAHTTTHTKQERFLSRKELAERWTMSTKTISRREQSGTITPVFFGERSIRYRLSEIEALEADATANLKA